MNQALSRGVKKGLRTLVQLAVGGGLTAAVNSWANGLDPAVQVYVLTGWTVLLALLQNTLETKGVIPTLLPTVGLITRETGGVLQKAVGAVDTVAIEGGQVVGDVINTSGKVVGGVVGTAGGLLGGLSGIPEDVETGEGI